MSLELHEMRLKKSKIEFSDKIFKIIRLSVTQNE